MQHLHDDHPNMGPAMGSRGDGGGWALGSQGGKQDSSYLIPLQV